MTTAAPAAGRPLPVATVVLLLVLAAAVHLPASLGAHYGEQDTARMVNDALAWSKADVRSAAVSEYRYYTSPGYILLARGAVRIGEATDTHPALVLNLVNLVAVVVVVLPAFVLFRRLAGDEAATLATVLLTFVPAFWQSGLYGFPHLLAALAMLCALIVFDDYLADGRRAAGWRLPLVVALLCLSVSLKADLYLSAVAFPGLMLVRGRASGRELLVAGAVLVTPVLLAVAVARLLLAGSPGTVAYLGGWNRQYSLGILRVLDLATIGGVVKSMGIATLPVFALALLRLLRTRRFALLAMLVAWTALPLVFWMSKAGDSSRHHFQATFGIALAIGLLLAELPVRRWTKYAAIALVVAVNYAAFAPTASTVTTSGNLFGSARMIRERVAGYHRGAEAFAAVDTERKLLLGSFTNPYPDNEVLRRAEEVRDVRRYRTSGYDIIETHYAVRGRARLASSVRVAGEEVPAAAAHFAAQGYRVFSMEYDACGRTKPVARTLEEVTAGCRDGELP